MSRRAEDKVRSLVVDLVNTADEEEQLRKIAELRAALHNYMNEVRVRLSGYPFVPERREHQAESMGGPSPERDARKKPPQSGRARPTPRP